MINSFPSRNCSNTICLSFFFFQLCAIISPLMNADIADMQLLSHSFPGMRIFFLHFILFSQSDGGTLLILRKKTPSYFQQTVGIYNRCTRTPLFKSLKLIAPNYTIADYLHFSSTTRKS